MGSYYIIIVGILMALAVSGLVVGVANDAVRARSRRIKGRQATTKSSMLYLNILNETKTMVLQSRNMLKSQKYFMADIVRF